MYFSIIINKLLCLRYDRSKQLSHCKIKTIEMSTMSLSLNRLFRFVYSFIMIAFKFPFLIVLLIIQFKILYTSIHNSKYRSTVICNCVYENYKLINYYKCCTLRKKLTDGNLLVYSINCNQC